MSSGIYPLTLFPYKEHYIKNILSKIKKNTIYERKERGEQIIYFESLHMPEMKEYTELEKH